jgi:hypothetical protein
MARWAVVGLAVRVALGLSVAFASGGAGWAQSLGDNPVFRIINRQGATAQGFAFSNPGGAPACLIATVTHVAAPGDVLTLIGERRTRAAPAPRRVETTAKYLDLLAPGLVVLKPDPAANLGDCAPWPMIDAGDIGLNGERLGSLRFVDSSGATQTLKVAPIGDARGSRTISIRTLDAQISPGLSGSLYMVGRTPLGVANSVAGGTATLISLGGIRPDPDFIADGASDGWSEFDVGQLPAEIRDGILQAREIYVLARDASERGQDAAHVAEDAAIEALRDSGLPNHSQLTIKGDAYYGRVTWERGGQGKPSGPGVRLSPEQKRTVACQWKDADNCDGYGRIRTPPDKADDTILWEGQMCGADRCGYGHTETGGGNKWYVQLGRPFIVLVWTPANGRPVRRETSYDPNGVATSVDWDSQSGRLLEISRADKSGAKTILEKIPFTPEPLSAGAARVDRSKRKAPGGLN